MWKSSWYELWFDSVERLTKLLKWVWWHFGSSWAFACLFCFASLWVLWDSVRVDKRCEILYVSFALVLAVLSFYLFLRSRLLDWAFNLHMIGVNPCWHHFLTRVKEGDGIKERPANLKETKNMHRTRVSRWSCSQWAKGIFWEYTDPHDLVIGRWECCRRVRREGNLNFIGFWWFGYNT